MTLDEFEKKLLLVKTTVISNRARLALKAAHDLNATVKLRIQETGADANGAQFSPYTPQYAKNGRRAKGYQAEYVDFTRTGRMTANIQPQVASDTPHKTLIVITARSTQERAKLRGQGKKRGNIIRPSQTELNVLRQQYGASIIALVRSTI